MDRLGHHAQKMQLLIGHDRDHVEQRVLNMSAEDVAGHVLGRRHVLQRRFREDLTRHLCLRKLIKERVFHGRIHLKRVSEPHLFLAHAGALCKRLVQKLRSQNRVRRRDRVVRGQVVILARVDDDARVAVDNAGEILVHDRTLHVDVAEQDAVQRVVQHDVEPFQCAHRRDLRHAQTRAVVA